MNKLIFGAALLTVALPGAASAMPWSWDLFNQPSHKAQEDVAPPTPEGIVPASGITYVKDRADAARLVNPQKATEESIKRGENRYKTYCLTCHGETGHGDGPVGLKYITPTDLATDYVRTKPDGDIFYTITYGGLAIMPSYEESVSPEDRWHIVNYIKHSLGR
ncbi:MAG: c-type cytochrome [Thermodesulfobacteriota bacterium]